MYIMIPYPHAHWKPKGIAFVFVIVAQMLAPMSKHTKHIQNQQGTKHKCQARARQINYGSRNQTRPSDVVKIHSRRHNNAVHFFHFALLRYDQIKGK